MIRFYLIWTELETGFGTNFDLILVKTLFKHWLDFLLWTNSGSDFGSISDLDFNAGIFTNITRDHLDYHKTFSNYINVKKSFFDSLNKNAISIVNKDDKNGLKMIESSKSKKITYSLKSSANHSFNILEYHFTGTLVKNYAIEFWINLVGEFNVYNILAVFSLANEYS